MSLVIMYKKLNQRVPHVWVVRFLLKPKVVRHVRHCFADFLYYAATQFFVDFSCIYDILVHFCSVVAVFIPLLSFCL